MPKTPLDLRAGQKFSGRPVAGAGQALDLDSPVTSANGAVERPVGSVPSQGWSRGLIIWQRAVVLWSPYTPRDQESTP